MTVREFKKYLERNNVPDNAEIVVIAEHGQNYEFVNDIWITRNTERDLDAIIWEFDGYEDIYDEDCVERYPVDGSVMAICLSGEVC